MLGVLHKNYRKESNGSYTFQIILDKKIIHQESLSTLPFASTAPTSNQIIKHHASASTYFDKIGSILFRMGYNNMEVEEACQRIRKGGEADV